MGGFVLGINAFSAACKTYPVRKLEAEAGKCPDVHRLLKPTQQRPWWQVLPQRFQIVFTQKQDYLLEG